MSDVSRKTDEDFLSEIAEVLEGNGTVPQAVKDRLILTALANVYRVSLCNKDDFEEFKRVDLVAIKDRLRVLEQKNLVLFYEKHTKLCVAIFVGIFITLNAWDFRAVIFAMLGFPPNLIP